MTKKKLPKISIEGDIPLNPQGYLYPDETRKTEDYFPCKINRDEISFKRILSENTTRIGLDFEFRPDYDPTIIGVASLSECTAISCSGSLVSSVVDSGKTLIGHSVIGAEMNVIEKVTGKKLRMDQVEDTMLTHFLLNMDLAKAPSKKEDDDKGAMGFMNLWTCASLVLDIPNTKQCREESCDGSVCPRHDVRGYCAVDAWDSIASFQIHEKEMEKWGLKPEVYKDLKDITYLAELMSKKGIKINMQWVNTLESKADEIKAKLFPYENETYHPFNPKSEKQIREYFAKFGVSLLKTDKATILKALTKRAKEYGFTLQDEDGNFSLEELADSDNLEEALDSLYKEYEYKSSGKGLAPWFNDKYRDANDFIHPRFITIGASTTRWSSSKPNFQNIPARGFGSLVRAAIVPRDDSFHLLKTDFSNLEYRTCVIPETKILKTDLSWKKARELNIGDELIGFDEESKKSKLRKSIVLHTEKVYKKCLLIKTDLGNITVSTDHLLISKNKSIRCWKKAEDLKIGDLLPFTEAPWEEDLSKNAGYLAGVFDGEGWISKCGIGFAQAAGDVLEKTQKILKEEGYTFGETIIQKDKKRNDGSKYTKQHTKNYIYGIWPSLKFLGINRPVRLIKDSYKIWENRLSWGKTTRKAKILSIENVGIKEVYLITTTTKTYIAEGFLSHNCMYLAGFDIKKIPADAFQWLVNESEGKFEKAARQNSMDARDVAKSVSHAGDYLEGFTLLRSRDLDQASTKRQIEKGSLKVYLKKYGAPFDWTFKNQIVAFTGANLAERLFGSKTDDNRKKALSIQEDIYFKQFPMLRAWQKSVLDEIEAKGYVRYPTSHFLRLYGTPLDDAKMATAALGQGVSAQHVQGVQLRFWRELNAVPIMAVHDELDFEIPAVWTDKHAYDFVRTMGEETSRLPEFCVPFKALRGTNWLEWKKNKPETHIEGAMKPLVI